MRAHSAEFRPRQKTLIAPSLPAADVVDFQGYFKVEVISPGEVLYRPGAATDKVYLLRSGRVRLLDVGRGRTRSVHAILKPGDLFGEVLRAEGTVLEEIAEASGRCEVWSIESRDFRALLEARPALAVDVVRALGGRVRALQQRVLGLTRKGVPARLAETLISLAGPADGAGRDRALQGITQQDLADLLGASRSFVSTLINKMKRDGSLASHGRVLVLADEAALAKAAAKR